MIKLTIKEIRGIQDPNPLANLIYNNFKYLESDPKLNHNIFEIKRLLTCNEFIGLLVYDNTKIIAYLVGETKMLNDSRLCYYITYFFVAEKYRNKKIGSGILNLLKQKCKNWGIKYIILTCDTQDKKLIDYYIKKGFNVDTMLRTNSRHEVYTLNTF
jgi:GNAT superfamily N-acetyltransferase